MDFQNILSTSLADFPWLPLEDVVQNNEGINQER